MCSPLCAYVHVCLSSLVVLGESLLLSMSQPLFSGQAAKETNEQASLCAQLIRLAWGVSVCGWVWVCECVGVWVVWVWVWVCGWV